MSLVSDFALRSDRSKAGRGSAATRRFESPSRTKGCQSGPTLVRGDVLFDGIPPLDLAGEEEGGGMGVCIADLAADVSLRKGAVVEEELVEATSVLPWLLLGNVEGANETEEGCGDVSLLHVLRTAGSRTLPFLGGMSG